MKRLQLMGYCWKSQHMHGLSNDITFDSQNLPHFQKSTNEKSVQTFFEEIYHCQLHKFKNLQTPIFLTPTYFPSLLPVDLFYPVARVNERRASKVLRISEERKTTPYAIVPRLERQG